jgi:3-oxoacyl-[acyl-carrier-protein] synthase-3
MNGREVFRFATRVMANSTREAVEKAGLKLDEIRWIIPHQANLRIIEAAIRRLDISMERCVVNLEHYGNTSTASIPIATVEAVEQKRVKAGDKLVFVGFGAGLTWGAMAVQWSGPILPKRIVYPRGYRTWVHIRSWLQRLVRQIEGIIWGRDHPET